MLPMKINTHKIKLEMKRTGLSLEGLAAKIKPAPSRQGVWYMIHRAKGLPTIEKIAHALGIDPKDLIIS